MRPFLVPASMGILQSWNWWPMGRQFPVPTKQLPEYGELSAAADERGAEEEAGQPPPAGVVLGEEVNGNGGRGEKSA